MSPACIFFKWLNTFLRYIKSSQKATATANIIYLDSRICRLCKWPALGLLCASIHYHHKAVDVSPLRLFCAQAHQPVHYRPVTRAAWEMAKQRGMSAWGKLTSCICVESVASQKDKMSLR